MVSTVKFEDATRRRLSQNLYFRLCSTVWDTGERYFPRFRNHPPETSADISCAGLDLYSANSFDKGKYWCGTAIQIAKNFDRGIYEKVSIEDNFYSFYISSRANSRSQ